MEPTLRRRVTRFQVVVAALCGLVLFLDGFDTQAISYAAPLIAKQWALAPGALGPIYSSALVGLMVGYLALSPLADRYGYKRLVIASTAAFGLLTLATVAADSLTALIGMRFLTGIGLGAAAPAVVALTDEYSPRHLRSTFVLAIYCGFSLGFVAAGGVAAWLLPLYGWTALFWIGAVLPLLLCPVLVWALPESLDYLVRSHAPPARITATLHRMDPALSPDPWSASEDLVSKAPVLELLRGGRATGTLLLWSVFLVNLAAFYLLQSWLPKLIMDLDRGMQLVAGATALSTVGGIAAAFVMGPAMDRLGACRSVATLFLLGALTVALLGPSLPAPAWQLMLASFCAGFCVSGGQKSAIALATLYYPAQIRSTGLGWALGVGRIGGIGGPLLGGALLGAGWTPSALFYLVAAAMVFTAAATLALEMVRKQIQQPSDHALAPQV